MRGPGILTRYVAREVLQYTLLGLAAISLILLVRNLGRFLDELLGSGFAASDVLLLCRVLVTMLLVYALPVSLLFGVLLAMGRMAADVEIVAMRACGVGLRQLVRPVLVLGLLVSAITWHLSLDVEPAARRQMRSAVASLVARGAGLEPGRFQRFGDVLVYVDERGGDRLHGVVVSDRRDPERPLIVFAREGHLAVGPDGMELLLALESGDIHLDTNGRPGERDVRIAFERFDYSLDLGALLGSSSVPRARDMSWSELRSTVAGLRAGSPPRRLRDEPIEYDLDLQRRLASPLAGTLFALVGLPIGMRRTRGARSLGALWCAVFAFLYYGLQTFCTFLATQGWIDAVVALWLPNAGFAGLAAVLLAQAGRAGA
jgi:lipopolysaccharide export system permease protein